MEGAAFSGRGTEENPYLINSADDLARLAELVNAGNALYNDKHYIQAQDIDLSGYDSWTPIGKGITPIRLFKGTYDGNSKDITELNIVIDTEEWFFTGLFGCVRGTIKNVNLKSGKIIAVTHSQNNVGGIVGCLYGGSIENCNNRISIIAQGKAESGGRVSVGGIVGSTTIQSVMIKGCRNYGSIKGISANYEAFAGGMIGLIDGESSIYSCSNNGNIYSEGYASSGGIAGFLTGSSIKKIEHCFNTGDVIVNVNDSGHMHAGGIAGCAYSTRITDCFNTGSVSEKDNGKKSNVGGIVGKGADTGFYLHDCYNIGMVSGGACKGAIAGQLENTSAVSSCYYADLCEAGIGSGSGITYKKQLDEMKLQSAYDGFDFDAVWTMDAAEETGYDFAQLQGNLLYPQRHNVELIVNDEEGIVTGSGAYVVYDNVTITAAEKEQYIFSRWILLSGDADLENPLSRTTSFIMQNTDVTIQAVFDKVKYSLSIESGSNGTVSGAGSYAWGSSVSLKATAYPRYQFMRWEIVSGGASIEDVYDMTTSFIMPQCDVSIRAVFGPNPAGYTYTVTGGKATITGYTGSDDSVQIPDRIGGYPVTAIGDYALYNETSLKSIIVPDTVESIGANTFLGCTSLNLIRLGKQVRSIGSGAFGYCTSLTDILVSPESEYYKSKSGVL